MPFSQWGIDVTVAIAGGVGGIFRYIIQPKRPWWEAFVAATAGVMMAVYIAPAAMPAASSLLNSWFEADVEPATLLASLGFLIGAMGRDVIERIIDFIRLYHRK